MKQKPTLTESVSSWRVWLVLITMLTMCFTTQAQVTIGSGLAPTYGALLELKDQQNVAGQATAVKGGFLLPRTELVGYTSLEPFIPLADQTNDLKGQLVGLMVYNIATTSDNKLYPGVYTWVNVGGSTYMWTTSDKNLASSPMSIAGQPKAFSFYEKGTETGAEVIPLEFSVNPPMTQNDDGTSTIHPVKYQWYQLIGNNIHARVGIEISSAIDASFDPTILFSTTKGSKSTLYAQNNQLLRLYCEATAGGATLTSNIVEVAVGCGAKNNLGEWISFMCFNLGAQHGITIQEQKDYPIGTFTNTNAGIHTYIQNEENLYGDLFQWGRIADGHEDRQSNLEPIGDGSVLASRISNGYHCTRNLEGYLSGYPYPYQQVEPGSSWYGKFITSTITHNNNWVPASSTGIDLLWRIGRFIPNDPCAKYKEDGTYVPSWTTQDVPTGASEKSLDVACVDSNTSWRLPQQEEWGAIYRGGTLSGAYRLASANTWSWYNGKSGNQNKGFEIKPDNNTTTLFLPAAGYRYNASGLLYYQGANGNYWSTSIMGVKASHLRLDGSSVTPSNSNERANGFSLRCIKN